MLAIVARSPELILDEKEAAEVAKASAMVSRHYDVKMAAKTVDWCNFGVVIATVYGTRILAIRNRVLDERKNKKQTIVPQQELKENTHAGFNSSDPLGGL